MYLIQLFQQNRTIRLVIRDLFTIGGNNNKLFVRWNVEGLQKIIPFSSQQQQKKQTLAPENSWKVSTYLSRLLLERGKIENAA